MDPWVGAPVFTDGREQIGRVVETGPGWMVVEHGRILVTDTLVPASVIAAVDEDGVRLRIGRNEMAGEDEAEPSLTGSEPAVAVERDELHIERRGVDRPATDLAWDGDELMIPVFEDRVRVTREARVVEEVEVGRRTHQDTEHVAPRQTSDERRKEQEDGARRR